MAATNIASVFGSTVLACTGTASSVTLPTGNGNQLMIQNDGANTGWWVVGTTTATATNATGASTPQIGGSVMIYTIDPNATVISGITSVTGNTTTLRITRCAGV